MIKILSIIVFFWAGGVAARVSFVQDLRIQYVGDSGPVEETVDVSPEAEENVDRGIPAHMSSVSVESQELSFIHFN